jgi:hypothetical protein
MHLVFQQVVNMHLTIHKQNMHTLHTRVYQLTRRMHTIQDMEEVVFHVLKSVTKPFRAGESYSISTTGTMASMHRVQLGAEVTSLGIRDSTYNMSVAFPSSLAASLSLPRASNVDVAIHVFQQAPIIADMVPMTPLVGVTLSRSDSAEVLNVSGLPDGINVTLPLTVRASDHQNLGYECMYWNGMGYSTEGCVATGVKTATSVQCRCNHLTTFVARVRHAAACICLCSLFVCSSYPHPTCEQILSIFALQYNIRISCMFFAMPSTFFFC